MGNELTVFRDDELLQIAEAAERRIDAVVKIKQVALKVTNARDWVNQDGSPYLMVSGSEKVANLFNISWRFLQPEPIFEEDEDGNFTYTYQGEFSMGGRAIQVEGSRSSKDGFFKQYSWDNGKKSEKDVRDRDNKRDVKMAALTNLLGNGITRLLGIRNLTWEDLENFAKIDRKLVKGFEYKREGHGKPTVEQPQRQSEKQQAGSGDQKIISDAQRKRFYAIAKANGKEDAEIQSQVYVVTGQESTKLIPVAVYDDLVRWAEKKSDADKSNSDPFPEDDPFPESPEAQGV